MKADTPKSLRTAAGIVAWGAVTLHNGMIVAVLR